MRNWFADDCMLLRSVIYASPRDELIVALDLGENAINYVYIKNLLEATFLLASHWFLKNYGRLWGFNAIVTSRKTFRPVTASAIYRTKLFLT